jgi:hypothetical protein
MQKQGERNPEWHERLRAAARLRAPSDRGRIRAVQIWRRRRSPNHSISAAGLRRFSSPAHGQAMRGIAGDVITPSQTGDRSFEVLVDEDVSRLHATTARLW